MMKHSRATAAGLFTIGLLAGCSTETPNESPSSDRKAYGIER